MVDCLLEYIYVDVITVVVDDLKNGFQDIRDFDFLRKKIHVFMDKIY